MDKIKTNINTRTYNLDMTKLSVLKTTYGSMSVEFDRFLAFMNGIFRRVSTDTNIGLSGKNLQNNDDIKLRTPDEVIGYIENNACINDIENGDLNYISILENSGIVKHILLDAEELLVLKSAVLHNHGTINLCGRTNSIMSLINKGLVHISYKNDCLVVNRIVNLMFGNINNDLAENNSNTGILYISGDAKEEIIKDKINENIIGLYWNMPELGRNK